MITRPTGADLLPFAPRPSYPGARLRAMQNARARREREAPPPDEAFDADRLSRDLASVPVDVRLNGEEREHLRRAGWTDERLRRAQAALRNDLDRRVHSPGDPAVTAGGGPGGQGTPRSRPSPTVASFTAADQRGMIFNVAAAKRAGYDPDVFYPNWRQKLLQTGSSRGPGPRAGGRPGPPGTGGGARQIVPGTSADRPVSGRPGRRAQ